MKSIRGATLKLVTTFAHGPNAMKWGWFSDRAPQLPQRWLFGDRRGVTAKSCYGGYSVCPVFLRQK